MTSGFLRDYAMYAVIFGFFAMTWFGWAQENPPKKWRLPLIIGGILSVIALAIGGLIAWQHWHDGSALSAPGSMKAYGITVGIEFTIAAIGAALLVWKKWSRFISPWIVFVVGIHFIALVPVFNDPSLYLLAVILTAIGPVSVAISRQSKILPSAVCGGLAGIVLLIYAVAGLIQAIVRL